MSGSDPKEKVRVQSTLKTEACDVHKVARYVSAVPEGSGLEGDGARCHVLVRASRDAYRTIAFQKPAWSITKSQIPEARPGTRV